MENIQKATQDVIKLKKEYEAVAGTDANRAQQIEQQANQIRQQYGIDEGRYGKGVTVADAYTNYYNDFANQQQGQQYSQQPNRNAELANLESVARQNADSYYTSQKAQIDAMLNSQISQLEMAYQQAIADGEISVRDAQRQFEQQKQALEQQAYQQSQATRAYGNEMGIQHSQQMVGLQQGDNARFAGLQNTNVSDRDARINDIRDRMNAIRKQKNLDIARAEAEHGYNLLGARGQADQVYSQQMFNLGLDDYTANRNQAFTQENMRLGHSYDLDKMGVQQGYTQDNMNLQHSLNKETQMLDFQNRLSELQEQSRLRIEEMGVGHSFDMAKMAQSLRDSIQLESIRYGHQVNLQDRATKSKIDELTKKMELEVKAEQQAYETARQRELAKYGDKNSPEYKIRVAQIDEAERQSLAKIHAGTVYEYTANEILGNDALLGGMPKEPKGSTSATSILASKGDWYGGDPWFDSLAKPNISDKIWDRMTGAKKKAAKYEKDVKAYLDAVERKNQFLNNPYDAIYGK